MIEPGTVPTRGGPGETAEIEEIEETEGTGAGTSTGERVGALSVRRRATRRSTAPSTGEAGDTPDPDPTAETGTGGTAETDAGEGTPGPGATAEATGEGARASTREIERGPDLTGHTDPTRADPLPGQRDLGEDTTSPEDHSTEMDPGEEETTQGTEETILEAEEMRNSRMDPETDL